MIELVRLDGRGMNLRYMIWWEDGPDGAPPPMQVLLENGLVKHLSPSEAERVRRRIELLESNAGAAAPAPDLDEGRLEITGTVRPRDLGDPAAAGSPAGAP